MKFRTVATVIVVLATLLLAYTAFAGELDPGPGSPPGSTSSYTLDDIYQRLNAGTAGTQSTFTEPSSGPGTGTMHSLNDIMGKAPVADNTSGATPAEVRSGKTFWGLRTDGTWGSQTGSMTDRGAVVITPGTMTTLIADGYHDGTGYVAGDTDLLPGNIRTGSTIFGVSGTCTRLPATGIGVCWSPSTQPAAYVDCAGTGQDGEYQLGCLPVVAPCAGADGCGYNRTSMGWASSAGSGFTDNGDGTVTDSLTGLIWLKDAACFARVNWDNSLLAANTLNSGECGLSDGSVEGDWRMPNLNELRSLIDPSRESPVLPAGHPFTNLGSDYYWSSTVHTTDISLRWIMASWDGGVQLYWRDNAYPALVWPVRGGQ